MIEISFSESRRNSSARGAPEATDNRLLIAWENDGKEVILRSKGPDFDLVGRNGPFVDSIVSPRRRGILDTFLGGL
jgi:hypothetical protein